MTTRRQVLLPLALAPIAGWAVWPREADQPVHPAGAFHLPLDDSTALWRQLIQVRLFGPTHEPKFPDAVAALDGKPVHLRGFMVPLSDDAVHSRFILAANPVGCAACQTPAPSTMVQVQTRTPLSLQRDPMLLTGTLRLRPSDGLFYRLDRAVLETA